MDFIISVQRAAEHATALKSVAANLEHDATQAAADQLELIGLLLEGEAKANAPRDTGVLQSSIFSELRTRGAALEEIVSTPLIYGAPLEFGRAPGTMPPTNALLGWVGRKLGLSGKEAQRAAYNIAKKIKAQGFSSLAHGKRQQMFQDAWDQNTGKVQQLLEEIGVHLTQEMLAHLR